MPRILLVDDEPQLVATVARALERQSWSVVAAGDGGSALEAAGQDRPDLIVLDLRLPDLDGVDVVRRLRPWYDGPILILSGVTDEARKVEALDAGADDFLNKPFGAGELTARIRALLRRGLPVADGPLHFPGLTVDLVGRAVHVQGRDQRLTPTEWRLLEALVSHPGRLLTHRWLLHQVWDNSYGDEARQSLRAHLRSLRAKLGDDATEPRFVRTETGAGYRWLPFPSAGPEPSSGEPHTAAPEPEGHRVDEAVPARLDVATPPDTDVVDLGLAEPELAASRTWDDIVHDLHNVMTSMRFAAFLAAADEPPEGDGQRWQRMVSRADELVAELEKWYAASGAADPCEASAPASGTAEAAGA